MYAPLTWDQFSLAGFPLVSLFLPGIKNARYVNVSVDRNSITSHCYALIFAFGSFFWHLSLLPSVMFTHQVNCRHNYNDGYDDDYHSDHDDNKKIFLLWRASPVLICKIIQQLISQTK